MASRESVLADVAERVVLGIKFARLDLETKDYGILGIEVTAIKAVHYPVDSETRDFAIATK